ncbi:hypothetical protein BD779DRAFT_1482190 [Infundibulicybe gibba]|nr:hypothetical protein BD779DRAFT_1482190 [Infundibulicybe gibba]
MAATSFIVPIIVQTRAQRPRLAHFPASAATFPDGDCTHMQILACDVIPHPCVHTTRDNDLNAIIRTRKPFQPHPGELSHLHPAADAPHHVCATICAALVHKSITILHWLPWGRKQTASALGEDELHATVSATDSGERTSTSVNGIATGGASGSEVCGYGDEL